MTFSKYIGIFMLFGAVLVAFGIGAYLLDNVGADMTSSSEEYNATNFTLTKGIATFNNALAPLGLLIAGLFIVYLLNLMVKRGKGY